MRSDKALPVQAGAEITRWPYSRQPCYWFGMLRQVLTCFALALAPAIDAANTGIHRADPARPFEPVVIVTKQPAYHDFYIHTLGDVAPEFQDITSLWARERVYLFVLAGNYAVSAANAMAMEEAIKKETERRSTAWT